MRLLFTNLRLGYAGNTSYTLDLATSLRSAGHEIRVCTTGGPLREAFASSGIETYLVKSNLLSYWKLLEFLREFGPDLVHIQNRLSVRFGRRISRRLGVPHVVTVHRLPEGDSPRIHHRLLAGVIAVNEIIRESLVNTQGIPKNLVRVIPRGVDVDLLAPDATRPGAGGSFLPVVGCMGSLTRVKGHDVLLRAARRVLDSGVEAMFAIVGDGEEERRLRRLAKDLRLERHVTFSPHIPDRRDLYRVFDIVVVPTLRGGIGSTVLEAMAMGKPVVASAVGEILHILQDRHTGLLVPEADAGALSERMVELVRSPELRERLGRAARARAEEDFALAPMVRATTGFYEEILTAARERGVAIRR